MLDMCNIISSETHPENCEYRKMFESMNPRNITYADVLKNQSGYLNAGMNPTPLIPKPSRIRLSEEAKAKIRAAIKDDPKPEATPLVESKTEKVRKTKKAKMKDSKPTGVN